MAVLKRQTASFSITARRKIGPEAYVGRLDWLQTIFPHPVVLEDATAGCKASSEEPWGPPRPCFHRETHHLCHVVEVRRTLGVEEESLPVYQESRNEECAQTLNTKPCVEVFASRRFPSEPMWPPHRLVPLANVRMVVTKGQGLETRWLPWPPAVLCRHYFSPQGCQNSR